MKWSKFRKLKGEYPWLEQTIDSCGILERDGISHGEAQEILRRMVRQKLTFIAFRPFERLELDVERNDGRNTAEYAFATDTYFDGNPQALYIEDWELVWHIGDRLDPRGRSIEWKSIRQEIDEAKDWHRRNFNPDDEAITFDRVLKWTMRGNTRDTVSEMSLEIFPFPPGWTFFPRNTEPPTPDSAKPEVTRAYMEGKQLPPVMPGMALT